MKILIVSCFFPPQNAIASQRPYSWAKYWSRMGHDVTVLTTTKDLGKPELTPLPFTGFRVLEIAPLPFFEWLRKFSRAAGKAPAESGVGGRRPSTVRRILGSWIGILRSRGLFSAVRMPDPFDLWVGPAAANIPEEKWDLIISTSGPYATLLVGWAAKRRAPDAKWICDFRDLWTKNHVYPGLWPFTWLEKRMEKFLLRRCSFATTVSQPLAEELQCDHPGLRVEVIPNGVDLEDIQALPPERIFPTDGKKRIVYTGSLHPVQRNPKPLFEAIASLSQAERSGLELIFVGPNVSQLHADIDRLGLAEVVRLLPPVPRTEALRMQRDADVLLFLEFEHEKSRDGVLTGKLFEYMASQKPIWAVGVGPASSVAGMLAESGSGRAFGTDVARISLALRELCGTKSTFLAPNGWIAGYERGRLASRLIEFVNSP